MILPDVDVKIAVGPFKLNMLTIEPSLKQKNVS